MKRLRDVKELLYTAAYHAVEIERVLDPKTPCFITFDPELGYVQQDYVFRDGQDGTLSQYAYERRGGHRRQLNGAGQPCRINTYGDSYTQCAQVNDGETWQEVLAAHFREPLRNFGVGGYGVHHACLRAKRTEPMKGLGAEYVVLNIWDDDYLRNLDAARWIRVAWMCRDLPRGGKDTYPVHGFPWAHVRYDLRKGKWVERPGLLERASDLRKLVGEENYYNAFKDDAVAHLYCLREGGEAPLGELEPLAEHLGVRVNLRSAKTRQADAKRLHLAYGIASTMFVVDRFRRWCKANRRKLLVLLSYDVPTVQTYLRNGTRFDESFVQFLKQGDYTYIDVLPKAGEAFRSFKGSINAFCLRFYVARAGAQVFGHYNPYGNFWFAHAIRGELVAWLDPKPPAYR